MRVTIIQNDNAVYVNGRAFTVDLSGFPADIHAVQWRDGAGHIEYKDGSVEPITSLDAYQEWVARWEAVKASADAIVPPTPAEIEAAQKLEAIAVARAEAQADTVLQYLRDHTPLECGQYVRTNGTTLTKLCAVVEKLAMFSCLQAKKDL